MMVTENTMPVAPPDRKHLLINNEWRAAASGATMDVVNPATEEVIAQVPSAGGLPRLRVTGLPADDRVPEPLSHGNLGDLTQTAEVALLRACSHARSVALMDALDRRDPGALRCLDFDGVAELLADQG